MAGITEDVEGIALLGLAAIAGFFVYSYVSSGSSIADLGKRAMDAASQAVDGVKQFASTASAVSKPGMNVASGLPDDVAASFKAFLDTPWTQNNDYNLSHGYTAGYDLDFSDRVTDAVDSFTRQFETSGDPVIDQEQTGLEDLLPALVPEQFRSDPGGSLASVGVF